MRLSTFWPILSPLWNVGLQEICHAWFSNLEGLIVFIFCQIWRRKNEWGFHFFFVLRRFSSWWQHFLLSAKAHYNFVPNKEGRQRRDSLVSSPACWLFSGSNHDDLATLQKTRMSRAEKMVIFSTHFFEQTVFFVC